MRVRDLQAIGRDFASAVRLVQGLRADPALWSVLSLWESLHWLAIHVDAATTKGIPLQHRRANAYYATTLLPRALQDVAQALRLRTAGEVDIVLVAAQRRPRAGRFLLVPCADATSTGTSISPAYRRAVPFVLRRDSSYWPRHVTVLRECPCDVCGVAIPAGAAARHRKHVGTCHVTCPWPLLDPPTIEPSPAA